MWQVYNLVRGGDLVTATTFRKVAKDSGTGAESERVKMKLTIQVEGVEFDPEGTALYCLVLPLLSCTAWNVKRPCMMMDY
jgi:stalled ribosome rescue protein Dom34